MSAARGTSSKAENPLVLGDAIVTDREKNACE